MNTSVDLKATRKRRRSATEIQRDRHSISRMYLRGEFQADIAIKLHLAQSTVSRHLNELHKEWLSSSLININEAKAKELAKIDHLELEAWDAWLESKKDAETIRQERIGAPSQDGSIISTQIKEIKIRKGQSGNPAFLERVAWCIEKRCSIFGLDADIQSREKWRAEIIELLKSGQVSPDDIMAELGRDLAIELFMAAGIKTSVAEPDQSGSVSNAPN